MNAVPFLVNVLLVFNTKNAPKKKVADMQNTPVIFLLKQRLHNIVSCGLTFEIHFNTNY